jgi:hypothetical protein
MADRKRPKYKVSPLSPEPKKPGKKPKKPSSTMSEDKQKRVAKRGKSRAPQQTVKPKRGDIRKAAKDTQKAAVKKAAVKTPKTKTSAKAKVKSPTSKVAGVGRGLLGRAMGWAAVPYLALESVAPVFHHLFPKTEAWKSTPKLKASQRRMDKAGGYKRSPGTDIHGGGGPYVGQQTDKAKKAVSPLEETGPVTARAPEKPKLGRQKVYSDTAGIPNMDVDITRQYKKPKSKVVKKSTKLPEIKSGGTVPDKPKATALKVSKSDLRSKQDTSVPKAPVAKKKVIKDFDTSMGVYGWNNLTNSFGYLGTEKEVGKYGASTYFTEGYRRGSKKKKK